MQLSVIVDTSGRLIAAAKRFEDPPGNGQPRIHIAPARPNHTLHHIDLPSGLERQQVREIVQRVKTYSDGRPPEIFE